VTIDASAMTGSLALDVSSIPDISSGGRVITIKGGSGNDILSNVSSELTTIFTGGGGRDTFVLATGGATTTITDLAHGDQVEIGGGKVQDTVVDATHIPGVPQQYIDGLTLMKAASVSANLAATHAEHQAVLFNYQGNSYVFVDVSGSHIFDGTHDAIVSLVGLHSAADISGVFYST